MEDFLMMESGATISHYRIIRQLGRGRMEEDEMSKTGNDSEAKATFGIVTRTLAGHCHNCKICAYADRKPDTAFSKLIHWHHGWCPARAAHTRVYGEQIETPAEDRRRYHALRRYYRPLPPMNSVAQKWTTRFAEENHE